MKYLLALIFSVSLFAEETVPTLPTHHPKSYQLLLDAHLSPKAASTSMLSLHSGLESSMDRLYKLEEPSVNQVLLRFAEMFFGWMPLNRLTVVTQHEVFGHGYRLRQFGSSVGLVTGYQINPPLPYGLGGGATAYFPMKNLGPMHKVCISLAGMEGTSLLAHELKMSWFQQGQIDPRQGYMYLGAYHDPTTYTLIMNPRLPEAAKGHDMESYMYLLRRLYPGSSLSVNQLKLLSIINFFDPMTYASANSMWHYVITGKEQKLQFDQLWNTRLGYAPYGPEAYVEHHRHFMGKPVYAYVKGGAFAKNRYMGCGVEHRHLYEIGIHKFGARTDLWMHPRLNFATHGYTHDKMYQTDDFGLPSLGSRLGGQLTGIYTIQGDGPFGAQVHLGVKSTGYLPGESLSAAPILRGSFHLKY